MKKEVIEHLTKLIDVMNTEESEIVNMNIYRGVAEVHLSDGLENIGHVKLEPRDSEKYPYELFVEKNNVKFFEIMEEEEAKERFPDLVRAYKKKQLLKHLEEVAQNA